MAKFLSNDRKVILQSAAAGVGIIAVLSLLSLLINDFLPIILLYVISILAVYWNVPTWFSRNRQLEKKEIKHFNAEGIEINKSSIPEYQYFNADGKEIRKLSIREQDIAFILLFTINVLLIFIIFPKLLVIDKKIIIWLWTLLTFTTPYLIRHLYCFVLDRPMDTSVTLNNGVATNVPHTHKYNDSRSRNTATSPSYSYLSYNINHRR